MTSNEIKNQLGQCFIVGFQGVEPSPETKKFIRENNIGGIILFDRNIESPAQLGDLTNELQDLAPQPKIDGPLFVSIDMEGGRVARLKAPFTQWPPMKILGEIGSASLAFKFAESMGKELRAVGINLDFSPCVDILTNNKNQVIGDRAFGSDAEIVSKMASGVVRGLTKSGVLACVKHFPGHGDTFADSHEKLPEVDHDLARLEQIEFVPFKRSFRARADLLMTAHIKLKKVDPQWPATLSPKILQEILRNKLGYRNIILSDDMEMKAVAGHWPTEEAAVQAFLAGCNILLYCHTLETQQKAFEAVAKAVQDKKIPEEHLTASYQMVVRTKKENLQPYKPVLVPEIAKLVGHPEHVKLSKQIARKEVPAGLTT